MSSLFDDLREGLQQAIEIAENRGMEYGGPGGLTELLMILGKLEFAIVMATASNTPFVALNKDDADILYRMLKENTTEVEIEGGGTYWYICGECRTTVGTKDKYCRECGRRLDWSGVYLKAPGAERVPDDLRSEGEEREQEPGEPGADGGV